MNRTEKTNRKKRKTKRKTNKWVVIVGTLLLSFLIISLGILGYTYSAEKSSETRNNDFAVGDLKTELVEEFTDRPETVIDEPIVKKVTVKNTGETDQFIRVMVIPEITKKGQTGKPDVLLASSLGKEVVLLDKDDQPITDNADWVDGKDGYFYYLKGLNVNKKTVSLFEKVKVATAKEPYTGAELQVHVKVESVGTTKWAYRDAWWQGQTPAAGTSLLPIDSALKDLAR